ncbi:MAG: HAMP domain-containing protein [Phenylobacterium sp.]|uniref:sensor histidine kinase n=1 Tax=Phenylobacterium sp. TaxID=1871053 RepID=UPI001A5B557B|nr:ATP-binding protein [Phenylobacterium sp.]MBL8556440.1 HAMP domain-containing protein [Phenylobacterium sp.]
MKLPALPRASIGVQLILLVLACLLAMHLALFAIVGLFPPPRPPIYRVAEIATALNGGALTARDGRPMVRTVSATLPKVLVEGPRGGRPPPLEALAAAAGQPREEVRIVQRRPGALDRFLREDVTARMVIEHRRRGGGRREPPPEGGDGPPPPHEPFERRIDGRPPPGLRYLIMREAPVIGDFHAALRRPDGRWTIVRPSPEPFPTDWQRRMALFVLAAFGVVAPAAFLFARRITAPLKRFSEAAERLGRDPHAAPVALSGPAEIGAAADAFNNMQSRLRRYIDDRTAMVGAISHDLRTPLARIRFKMEGAAGGLKDTVLADVAQMEQMIAGVLAFIRDESTPRHREKLDLLSLVECVVDDAALVGGDVELLESGPVQVEGDAVALQRLFVNLVDNALKHAGQARIRVRREDDQAVVEITDEGPGLAPEDLERAFQPFFRADASRNLDSGGIGLGLPIARSTARAHGGDVELIGQAKGLKARVTLPVA